ncbi:hypothetical protein [Mycolicibacter virginiensis]|uniref:hypothetical protein n=1 Tax=Mycolicibacter virginiensis TaxID=1795032 RepID=UPI001F03A063|nr:hypothetical protein [Mycolicibacter virginiensis]ULP45917.1 hypothetical protein MJO54_13660 [Mycolicibacter virginiensis]
MKLIHHCEICRREEILTPDEAFQLGWDYPPRMGAFGVISPRTCGNCLMKDTVWAALMMQGKAPDQLTDRQLATIARIQAEPASITVPSEN